MIGELAGVAVLELIEDDAPRLADTERVFEQVDQLLGGQPAGQRLERLVQRSQRSQCVARRGSSGSGRDNSGTAAYATRIFSQEYN